VYLTNFIVYPLIFLVLAYVILPVYMRHKKVTSAYELLEKKLGVSVRLLGVVMFLMLRLVWMALLIFMTAKAIAVMVGVDEKWVPLIVAITGVFAVTYTTLGGLRAVVITDLMQTILLYCGALLVIGTVTWKMGGFGWFPTEWQSDIWETQPVFSLDPSTRVTVVGTLLSVFLWMVCTAAGDQVSVQRYMATENTATARRAMTTWLIVGTIVGVTLGLVGFALLGYFQAHPELLPAGVTLQENADKIFPHFIAHHLPPVVTGLVVSGLFAAAMSSIDSGVNSITAVVMTDFLERSGRKPDTDEKHIRFARWMAIVIGVIVVLLSSFVGQISGNFLAVTQKTVNLLTVPIFLLFFFALFVPFANARGVWIGAIASVTVAVLIAFGGQIFGQIPGPDGKLIDPISFQWISPAALVAGVGVGLVACKLFSKKESP
jgi:SSS family solute:Na+ symporter